MDNFRTNTGNNQSSFKGNNFHNNNKFNNRNKNNKNNYNNNTTNNNNSNSNNPQSPNRNQGNNYYDQNNDYQNQNNFNNGNNRGGFNNGNYGKFNNNMNNNINNNNVNNNNNSNRKFKNKKGRNGSFRNYNNGNPSNNEDSYDMNERLNQSLNTNLYQDMNPRIPSSISLDNFDSNYKVSPSKMTNSFSFISTDANSQTQYSYSKTTTILEQDVLLEDVPFDIEKKKPQLVHQSTIDPNSSLANESASFYSTPMTHNIINSNVSPTPFHSSDNNLTSEIEENKKLRKSESSSSSSPDSRDNNEDSESQLLVTASEGESSFGLETNIENTITNVAIESSFALEIESAFEKKSVKGTDCISEEENDQENDKTTTSVDSDHEKSQNESIVQADQSNISSSSSDSDSDEKTEKNNIEKESVESESSSTDTSTSTDSSAESLTSTSSSTEQTNENSYKVSVEVVEDIKKEQQQIVEQIAPEIEHTETEHKVEISKTEEKVIDKEELNTLGQDLSTSPANSINSGASLSDRQAHNANTNFGQIDANFSTQTNYPTSSISTETDSSFSSLSNSNQVQKSSNNDVNNLDEASLNCMKIAEEEVNNLVNKIVLDVISQAVHVAPENNQDNEEESKNVQMVPETHLTTDKDTLRPDAQLKIIEINSPLSSKISEETETTSSAIKEAQVPKKEVLIPVETDTIKIMTESTTSITSNLKKPVKNGKSNEKKEPVVDCFSCTIV